MKSALSRPYDPQSYSVPRSWPSPGSASSCGPASRASPPDLPPFSSNGPASPSDLRSSIGIPPRIWETFGACSFCGRWCSPFLPGRDSVCVFAHFLSWLSNFPGLIGYAWRSDCSLRSVWATRSSFWEIHFTHGLLWCLFPGPLARFSVFRYLSRIGGFSLSVNLIRDCTLHWWFSVLCASYFEIQA